MKKCDIGIVAIIYAICLCFLYMTLQLPDAAQIYPLCLIAALGALNTLYIVRAVLAYVRTRVVEDDFKVSFGAFLPVQFTVCMVLCALYMVLLWLTGFYIASVVYLVGTMTYLRVPVLHLVATTGVMMALIYGVFTLFLKVPLPVGQLFL